MPVPSVSPLEAHALLQHTHVFLDVRSEVEFALGHVPQAYNVPLMHPVHDELIKNEDFLAAVRASISCDTPVIVGCHAVTRAKHACSELQKAGYVALLRMSPGWYGDRDAFGRLIPGWSRLALPVETDDGGERSYAMLQRLIKKVQPQY